MKKKSVAAILFSTSALCTSLPLLWSTFAAGNPSEELSTRKIRESDLERKASTYTLHQQQRAEKLLQKGLARDSLAIIAQHEDEIGLFSPASRRWLRLFIAASKDLKDSRQLSHLYTFFPAAFAEDEEASIEAANGSILLKDINRYDDVRALWRGKENNCEAWFDLDVERKLLSADRAAAISLLERYQFNGKRETLRLLKLALLNAAENSDAALQQLSNAIIADPFNAEFYLYRANFLDSIGRDDDALIDYSTAYQLSLKSPHYGEKLARYYVKKRNFPLAIATWEQISKQSKCPFSQLKGLFWQKVAYPADSTSATLINKESDLAPLISYITTLPSKRFWDEHLFQNLPRQVKLDGGRQEIFWLSLLENLRQGDEENALRKLENSDHCQESWAPELQDALTKVLRYRAKRDKDKLLRRERDSSTKIDFTLLQKIIEFEFVSDSDDYQKSISPELAQLLNSSHIFCSLFLAAGWEEAAIQLCDALPENQFTPVNLAIALTGALQRNRNCASALLFGAKFLQSNEMMAMIAEMIMRNRDDDQLLSELNLIARGDKEVLSRACWLRALLWVERGDYKAAKALLNEAPQLLQSVSGQELLARVALLQGDESRAKIIYENIKDSSPEAKSFLARRAFCDNNWQEAQLLTEELLLLYPESDLLLGNLIKIHIELDRERSE